MLFFEDIVISDYFRVIWDRMWILDFRFSILSFRRRRNHTKNSSKKITNLCRAASVISPFVEMTKKIKIRFYPRFRIANPHNLRSNKHSDF
jgi:hypothetical protein